LVELETRKPARDGGPLRLLVVRICRPRLARSQSSRNSTALKATGAVRDLGIGRSTFYSLLKTDAGLMAASFMIGTGRV